VSWRIEHGPDGRPCRAWFYLDCTRCGETGFVLVPIEGARVPQRRPCPECSGARIVDGISPKPLTVL
jgi:hypothetical protein